jgi:hypothetical protein
MKPGTGKVANGSCNEKLSGSFSWSRILVGHEAPVPLQAKISINLNGLDKKTAPTNRSRDSGPTISFNLWRQVIVTSQ